MRIDEISPDGEHAAKSTARADEPKAEPSKADAAATDEVEKKPARRTRTKATAEAKPTDGGFLLRMRRISPR